MAQSNLKVRKREKIGKSGAKELRRQGLIPGIVYGKDDEPIPLVIDPNALKEAISGQAGRNTLLNLEIDDNGETITKLSILSDIQIDRLTRHPIHIDLHTISADSVIHVGIPVHFNGLPVGVKEEGGILEELIRELEVECLPSNIPNSIEVDVSWMSMGDAIHISDLDLPEDVIPLDDPGRTVVTVGAPVGMSTETELPEELEEELGEEVEGEEGEEVEGEEGEETEEEEDNEDKG